MKTKKQNTTFQSYKDILEQKNTPSHHFIHKHILKPKTANVV